MIDGIVLRNFRNFMDISLDIKASHVVLHGDNGSGKSTILEAVSLFSVGKGLKKARPEDLINISAPQLGWSAKMGLKGDVTLKTMFKPQLDQTFKKISFLQEEQIKSHTKFADFLNILWITPETDRLFLDTPSVRRKFVDRFVYAQDVGHLKRVTRYEEAVRERLKLLKTAGLSDTTWLDALEKTIAEEGILLAQARLKLLAKLSTFQPRDDEKGILPGFKATMNGPFEDLLSTSDDNINMVFLEKLKTNRYLDRESGMTHFGPHRSDLFVWHPLKNIGVYHCSTGEQKVLLLSLLIAFIEMFCINAQTLTVFLLDDVVAHLDVRHRTTLYKRLTHEQNMSFQTWFSGTDEELFEPLLHNAQFIDTNSL